MTLTRAVATFLGIQLLATSWAVWNRLPYEFGGRGSPDHVLREFWSHGTALSAPAPLLVVVALVALLTRREGRLGTVAVGILLVIMGLSVIAGALEPAVRQALRGDLSPIENLGVLALTGLSLGTALTVMLVAGSQFRRRLTALTHPA
jgi:hypothetical protein